MMNAFGLLLASVVMMMAPIMISASSGSASEACREIDTSNTNSNDLLGDLCAAQVTAEATQAHLQRAFEKLAAAAGGDIQKRKNEFVRFGRSDAVEEAGDAHEAAKRKNEFVRFGKRKNEFVRFGKKSDISEIEQPQTAEKRKNEFVRFG